MAEDTRRSTPRGGNESTRIAQPHDLELQRTPLGARDAFLAAYDRLRNLPGIARRPAVLVVAVDGAARVVEAVLVEAGHSLIIGRHSQCGLRLPSDLVSLRQLALHAHSESPDAAPDLWLWDLNTEQPFLTEDGQPNAAVSTQGTLYAAVGEYALLFVPTPGPSASPWPQRADEAWKTLPPRQFIDHRTPTPDRLQHGKHLRVDGQEFHTRITRGGPLLLLGEQETALDAWGALRLVAPEAETEHHISLARLEQGVLLGRYERCGIPVKADGLSRVHLLLVRLGTDVLAIDIASTNGTWRGTTEVRTTSLEDLDSLTLANHLHVHWRRLPHAATNDGP